MKANLVRPARVNIFDLPELSGTLLEVRGVNGQSFPVRFSAMLENYVRYGRVTTASDVCRAVGTTACWKEREKSAANERKCRHRQFLEERQLPAVLLRRHAVNFVSRFLWVHTASWVVTAQFMGPNVPPISSKSAD